MFSFCRLVPVTTGLGQVQYLCVPLWRIAVGFLFTTRRVGGTCLRVKAAGVEKKGAVVGLDVWNRGSNLQLHLLLPTLA